MDFPGLLMGAIKGMAKGFMDWISGRSGDHIGSPVHGNWLELIASRERMNWIFLGFFGGSNKADG